MDRSARPPGLLVSTDQGRPNKAILLIICAAGLLCLARAICVGELEWRLVALIAPAALLTRVRGGFSVTRSQTIEFSLAHPILFACALALGPVVAAVPAACSGIARLLSGGATSKPVLSALYTVLKPVAVCCAAAAVYTGLGGSTIKPQEFASLLPVIASGAAYIAAGALMVGLVEGPACRDSGDRQPRSAMAAAWCLCLFLGYANAVLYAIAPSYVLLAPVAAVGLLRFTTRERHAANPVQVVGAKDSDDTPVAPIQPECTEPIAATPPVEESQPEGGGFVDAATGLANRRYAEMFLGREISRADRLDHPLSAAVFDLDSSKQIAETAGPDALDAALREIGARLKVELRDYDVVARYSDSRLLVLLPEISTAQALDVVQRLHASLAEVETGNEAVSVSVGVAAFPAHATCADSLVNSAHRALNRGRFSGPNRITTCEELDKAS